MRTGVFTFLLISLLAVSPTAFAGEVKEPIDQTITREIDLTGDGVPELISVHLMAKNFDSPFRWKLTITSKGKDIYTVERDDAWFDRFFSDRELFDDCPSYHDCKKKYYFDDLPTVVIPKTLYNEPGIMGDHGTGTIWEVGKDFLMSERHMDVAKAEKIIATVLVRYRTKALPLISISISPVKGDSPMIYVEEINGFMPVYRE